MKFILLAITLPVLVVAAPSCSLKDLRTLGGKEFVFEEQFSSSTGKQFIFREHSTNTFFVKPNAIKDDLALFTLSFFVKMETGVTVGHQCIFSYATPSSPYGNGLYICLSPTIRINIGNVPRTLKTKIPDDSQMPHISVTWDNKAGSWQLYMNGLLTERGTGFKRGHVIPRGGTAVIGQDQDVMGRGFDVRDAFGPGVGGALNMWDKILSECDIAKQVIRCNIPHGSVLGMYQFRHTMK